MEPLTGYDYFRFTSTHHSWRACLLSFLQVLWVKGSNIHQHLLIYLEKIVFQNNTNCAKRSRKCRYCCIVFCSVEHHSKQNIYDNPVTWLITWTRRSYVLETTPLPEEYKPSNFAGQLLKIADTWEIGSKIKVVVSNKDGIKRDIKKAGWGFTDTGFGL